MVTLPIKPAIEEERGYIAFGVGIILSIGDLG